MRGTRQTNTVGERLAQYIGDGPGKSMSVRAFATAMQRRRPRPRGSTRAMIHRYLDGAAPPSDFIEAAADILSISREWLAFGTGARTAAEAAAVVANEERDELVARLRRELRRAVPDLGDVPYAITVAMLHHLDVRVHTLTFGADTSDWIGYAKGVWRDVVRPLGGRRPKDMLGFGEYVIAALHARNLALLLDTYETED